MKHWYSTAVQYSLFLPRKSGCAVEWLKQCCNGALIQYCNAVQHFSTQKGRPNYKRMIEAVLQWSTDPVPQCSAAFLYTESQAILRENDWSSYIVRPDFLGREKQCCNEAMIQYCSAVQLVPTQKVMLYLRNDWSSAAMKHWSSTAVQYIFSLPRKSGHTIREWLVLIIVWPDILGREKQCCSAVQLFSTQKVRPYY